MNNKEKGNGNIGIGLCGVILGIAKLISPSLERPTGRWSFIFGPLFDLFGVSGVGLINVIIGVTFIYFGFYLRRKK